MIEKLRRPFTLDIAEVDYRKTIETARIILGVVLIHRYVDIAGFVIAADNPARALIEALTALGFSVALTVGFLTPLALLGLLFFSIYTPFGFTLGHQMITVATWVMLFAGAGTAWSLDSKLLPRDGLLRKALYFMQVPFSRESYAWMRFAVVFLYWGMTFSALAFHYTDELWLEGKVLQILLATPYMSDLAGTFAGMRDAAPGLYGAASTVSIAIQGFFELLVWPLFLFRWGRAFVAVQWLGFIVIRVLTMNLGYLSFLEIVLWILVFTTKPWNTILARASKEPTTPPKPIFPEAALRTFVAVGVLVSVYFNAVNFARINFPDSAVAHSSYPGTLFRVFAQWPVNVFNKEDMQMGNAQLVLAELSEDGKIKRVVPFLDHKGGRLSYLRNDFMYFGISLPWQRMYRQGRVSRAPTLAHRVALVDASLQDGEADRLYAAMVFGQQREPFASYTRWTESNFYGGFRIQIPVDELRERQPDFPAYDLGPGHVGQEARLQETFTRLRELEEKGAFQTLQVLTRDQPPVTRTPATSK